MNNIQRDTLEWWLQYLLQTQDFKVNMNHNGFLLETAKKENLLLSVGNNNQDEFAESSEDCTQCDTLEQWKKFKSGSKQPWKNGHNYSYSKT